MLEKTTRPIQILAPAKINLFLHIIGKTHDGYHQLQSLIAFADVGDIIEVTKSDGFSFHTDGPFSYQLPENQEQNLVIKAAHLISQHCKKPLEVKITLKKNLPIGAGIGGGSADAAATIKALLQLWQIQIEPDELNKILISLGADVPVCYAGKSCYAEGIGEIISPATIPSPLHGVLIYPHKFCSTKDIFSNHQDEFSIPMKKKLNFQNSEDLISFVKKQQNDLTPSALKNIPEINDVLNTLGQQDQIILSRMSGSGSSCFGLFNTKESCQKATEKIQKEKPDWWVRPILIQ